MQEFISFLKQYGVIGLAIAVIIGGKANALVSALVDGVLMPIVTFFIPGGAWRTATLDIGSVHLLLGPVFGTAVDFLSQPGIPQYHDQQPAKQPGSPFADPESRWARRHGSG